MKKNQMKSLIEQQQMLAEAIKAYENADYEKVICLLSHNGLKEFESRKVSTPVALITFEKVQWN